MILSRCCTIFLILSIIVLSSVGFSENVGIVSCDGNQFVLNGSPFYYAGANNYYQMVFAADLGLRSAVDEVQEEMANMGMTVLRTWAFNDGASQWNALQPFPGTYQESVFQGLDYVLYKADLEGLRVILPFVNNWDDYGGMNQYVTWADSMFPGNMGFVETNGTHFEIAGRPYYYVGMNYWYGMNLASNGPGGDRVRLLAELDSIRALGVTNLRVMAGAEGPNTEPWRIVPAMQTSPGVYDSLVLDGLDYLIYAMKDRGIRAVMCLTNFWQWSGGMAQYVSWNGGGSIPYPPPEPGGDWNVYQDYASDFYSNAGAMQDFQDHISFIINHVNPYTELAYRDEPTIMSWELGNEPRGYNNNATNFNLWIDNTAAYIKSLDSNHLVTTGCEGDTPWPSWNGLNFTQNHNGPDIDYTTIHIWPQNWGWYDPTNPGGTYASAESSARSYFNNHEAIAQSLGKPMVLEEFGLARDNGSYDPTSSTSYRDTFFGAMYQEVYTSASTNGPAAGSNFWAWAGAGRPLIPYGSHWNIGDPWIGDPPHEDQGWYSVYDTDSSTLDTVSNHATQMRSLTPSLSHDDFYTDIQCRQFYQNHISTIFNRVNTFNGCVYKEDPTVFAWELANEPECISDASGDILQAWVEEMSAYIKSVDSLHMVTTGSEGFYGMTGPAHNPASWMTNKGVDFIRNHQPVTIDFACYHSWPDWWGMGYTVSINWVNNHTQDTDDLLGKPVILEEYGKQQPISTRDTYFQSWLNEIYNGGITGQSSAGSNLWILYHDVYPDYDGFGVYYPAHSSTIAILEDHAGKMNMITDAYASCKNGVKVTSQIDTGTDDIFLDDENVASLDSTATDGYDSGFDVPEPSPPASNYVSVYFPHPEWGSSYGDDFQVDIRNANDNLTNAVKIFQFEVDTDQNNEQVDLSFTIGNEYSSSYGVVLYDLDNDSYQNLREDSSYSYTAGLTERSFDLRLGDGTAPVIDITFPGENDELESNTQYTITWTYTDASPIRYSKLYYSLDAGSSWTLIDSITGSVTTYQWTTPDTSSIQAKLKVEAWDWPGNYGSEITNYTFSIVPGAPEHGFQSGWHMISVPIIPEYSSVDSIFGDDVVGTFFVYDYSQASGYGVVTDIDHGAGYWLALENSATVDVEGTPETDSTYLPLTLNWNIVGAAQTDRIALNSLYFTNGSIRQPYVNAVNAGWISPACYLFNNSVGSYDLADTLSPWYGYWFQALQSDIQMITPPPSHTEIDYTPMIMETDDENNWFVPVLVTMGDLSDQLAGFGVHPDATDGYDTWHDLPSPPFPPTGDYIRLVFYHLEWLAPVGDVFSQDLRAPFSSDTTITWEGVVEASDTGQVVLNFGDIIQLLPNGYWAIAEYGTEIVDLLDSAVVSFQFTESLEIDITISNELLTIDDLTITLNGLDIELDWGDIPGTDYYYIYRSDTPIFDISGMSPIDSSSTAQYIDAGIATNQLFFYRVTHN